LVHSPSTPPPRRHPHVPSHHGAQPCITPPSTEDVGWANIGTWEGKEQPKGPRVEAQASA